MTGAVGLVCTLAPDEARAAKCAPVATVEGSVRIAALIRGILRAHGVSARPGSCPDQGVRATLAETGPGNYRLHIEDAFGRHSDRQVSDADTAASLIESWAVPAADDAPLAAPPAAAVRRAADSAPPGRVVQEVRGRLSGSLELAGGSDNSLWYGSAVTGCAAWASLCVGGRARLARDDSVLGPDRDLTRWGTELLLLASRPVVRGTVTLTPMLGLGVGWVHTGPARPEETHVSTTSSDDLGVRVEAAASAGLGVSAHISLVGEVGASWGGSIASTRRDNGGATTTVAAPGAYLRAAIACQYAP